MRGQLARRAIRESAPGSWLASFPQPAHTGRVGLCDGRLVAR